MKTGAEGCKAGIRKRNKLEGDKQRKKKINSASFFLPSSRGRRHYHKLSSTSEYERWAHPAAPGLGDLIT